MIVKRKPVSLAEIIKQHASGIDIDFISIDCEGHDFDVLKSNDWLLYRPKLVVVEDHEQDNQPTEIDVFMQAVGYMNQISLGLSKIFRLCA